MYCRCLCHDSHYCAILICILSLDIIDSRCVICLDYILSILYIAHEAHVGHSEGANAWSEIPALFFELVEGLLCRSDTVLALVPGLQMQDT